ncbi:hypothetical protein [Bacteriovorax sp. Seq25_V]|uniref:hypothetical protein n=1 Tax=Bacteriovorax sp. Seq25_V TaxID=1201288 RepID=UPI000389FCA5|nr:hypothetical protein [Bacteriovorax sp. Seq25_V]EQC45541.1 hypothetical protein M900_2206 [Bacteriovorax sp. Seq25_V]
MKTTLILLLTFYVSAYSECQIYLDDCEYYSCVESIKSCGKTGYPVGFGKKYCNKFEKNLNKFSHSGQNWVTNVKHCLIQEMELISEAATCSAYKTKSVSKHVPCYISSGYCSLSKKDKRLVIKTIKGSLWRPSIIKAGLKVLSACK